MVSRTAWWRSQAQSPRCAGPVEVTPANAHTCCCTRSTCSAGWSSTLRELLLDAIRYGELPEVRARLDTAVDQALDRATLQDLLEERQLVHDAMDASRVQRVREEMEQAEARRLQPHYIESFFHEAFRQLGGSARQRETRRYQVSAQLALEDGPGKTGARLNSGEARRRADTLQHRLQKRIEELKRDAQISPRPPVVLGGLLVVPQGLVDKMAGRPAPRLVRPDDTLAAAARARAIVMETERRLGFEPTDRELDKLGYDIESRDPATGKLRFIEVKGRRSDADTVTVTKNEVLYSLNKPDDFILALVLFGSGGDDTPRVHYVRRPFQREPDFKAASVNYALKDLLASAEDPRQGGRQVRPGAPETSVIRHRADPCRRRR